MLDILIPSLKNGLELAFLLATLSAYLKTTRQTGLLQPLTLGVLLALAASLGLAYGMESFLEREVVEGSTSLLAAALSPALAFWIGFLRKAVPDGPTNSGSPPSGKTNWFPWALVFCATLALVTPRGLSIGVISANVFAQSTGLLSTEQVVKDSAILGGLALAGLVGLTLYKVVAGVGSRQVAPIAILGLFIILVQEATIAVQMMLVLGILPLTDWLFRIIVPLINNYSTFYYALLASSFLLVLLASWQHRRRKYAFQGLNPAQVRKIRALSRRTWILVGTVSTLLAIVILVDGANAIHASRPISLSPAIPVTRQGDVVTIPTDSVSDGKLHRFSYEAADATVLRFLVIHKGSGIFGMGLDACEFCGAVGYHQEGKNVICNRCHAAINVATVGFPGGCNPIPLGYSKEESSLIIQVEVLEARKGIFRQ